MPKSGTHLAMEELIKQPLVPVFEWRNSYGECAGLYYVDEGDRRNLFFAVEGCFSEFFYYRRIDHDDVLGWLVGTIPEDTVHTREMSLVRHY
jgi:hypothetical protein